MTDGALPRRADVNGASHELHFAQRLEAASIGIVDVADEAEALAAVGDTVVDYAHAVDDAVLLEGGSQLVIRAVARDASHKHLRGGGTSKGSRCCRAVGSAVRALRCGASALAFAQRGGREPIRGCFCQLPEKSVWARVQYRPACCRYKTARAFFLASAGRPCSTLTEWC